MTNTNDSTCIEQPFRSSTPPQIIPTAKVALLLKYTPTSTSALPRPISTRKTTSRTPAIAAKTAKHIQSSRIPKRVLLKKKVDAHTPIIASTPARSLRPYLVSRSSPLRNEVSLFELAFADEPASFHDLRVTTTSAITPIVTNDLQTQTGCVQSSIEYPPVSIISLRSIDQSAYPSKLGLPSMSLKKKTTHSEPFNEECIYELLPTLSSLPPINRTRRDASRTKILFWIQSRSQGFSNLLSKRSIQSSKEERQNNK